ncbi:MAG: hypothetical protein HUU22_15110 [Phycisphaerae bacterium]|nr:hypothetical protein [Phycisphaerae bacterium]NUQ47352.1 hypothetical protein [Phycisphaerae bacterium]
MQYVPRAHGSEWAPKLLGTYECEIAPAIEEALTRKPRLFVNIGGGEGYYAVGLALRSPGVETVCFESSRRGRSMIRRLADHNDVVDRLRVFGTCNREALAATLSHGSRVFVLCDVEGAEWELLDPVAIPSLREADVLVELHEFRRPGVGEELIARFRATHSIESIAARSRSPEDCPIDLASLAPYRSTLLSEERPPGMSWLWMRAVAR